MEVVDEIGIGRSVETGIAGVVETGFGSIETGFGVVETGVGSIETGAGMK